MNEEIDSYISFYEEFGIAEEGLKDIADGLKKVWLRIYGMFRKLRTFLKSLSKNIGYFKNAKLPSKMSEDLQSLLQNLTPRREYLNKLFPLLMNSATKNLVQNKHLSNDPMKDVDSQVDMSIRDVASAVNDVMSSEPYKRLQGKKYDFTDMKIIPMNSVVGQMKKAEMEITNYENMLKRFDNVANNPKSENERRIAVKLKKLYNALIVNLEVRCKLLLIYFKTAKASLKGTLNNIKNHGKGLPISRSYKANKNKARHHIPFVKKNLNEGEMKRFKEIDRAISATNNEYDKFEEYSTLVKELCALIGIGWSNDKVLLYDSPSKNPGQIKYSYVKDDGRTQKILDNTKLYHTSTDHSLRQLSPRYFFHSGDLLRRLWPSPRVYFSIGIPISNDGNASRDKVIYVPKININEVNIDEEMGGTAVYVTRNAPIPVEKLDIKSIEDDLKLPSIDR